MANAQPQAGAAPEAIWMPSIYDLYHNLLSETFFLPPLHFNRTPHDVAIIAGQTVLVRVRPSTRGRRLQQPAPPPAQVAGTVFVENDPNIEPALAQDSDWQDDRAQQRCLQALSHIPNQVMIVLSNLEFQKYLNNHTNPLHAAAIAQLPSIQHPSIPQNIANGECDIVVIHRQYGLIIGELKSVGGSPYFRSQTPGDQTQLIIKQVKKALNQLNNQETALSHLVIDLPPIRITKTLLLPNITARQLRQALRSSPPLLQMLCQAMSLKVDVGMAVRHCLCKKDRKRPSAWWRTMCRLGPDPSMTDGVYQRLVARFCGPATTVDIATAGLPRKVVRSTGEAVAETGLRFSSLTLTPHQVALLDRLPEPQFIYLMGPPGTGKTVVLLLKALQWVQQGRQVVIVIGGDKNRAVSLLLEEQLRSMAGPAAANVIQRLCYDFREDGFDAGAAVTSLQQHVGPGPVLVICDEFDPHVGKDIPWLTEVHDQLPAVTVWTAGIMTDVSRIGPLPSWLQVETLQEALRCPPSVTALLRQSQHIQNKVVLQYTDPQVAVATQGPPVQRLHHKGQPGHSGHHPWQCVTCADRVVDIIHQLRVGQLGQPLQYRDVWIMYDGATPRADDVIVRHLQQHHRLPVVVAPRHPSEDEAWELAVAVTDHIVVTESNAVQGLERRVVVALGSVVAYVDLSSWSRCSSSLYIIA